MQFHTRKTHEHKSKHLNIYNQSCARPIIKVHHLMPHIASQIVELSVAPNTLRTKLSVTYWRKRTRRVPLEIPLPLRKIPSLRSALLKPRRSVRTVPSVLHPGTVLTQVPGTDPGGPCSSPNRPRSRGPVPGPAVTDVPHGLVRWCGGFPRVPVVARAVSVWDWKMGSYGGGWGCSTMIPPKHDRETPLNLHTYGGGCVNGGGGKKLWSIWDGLPVQDIRTFCGIRGIVLFKERIFCGCARCLVVALV